MAKTDNYLLFQKSSALAGTSSESWGIFVKSIPPIVANEVKEPDSNSWLDEHGVDTYDAQTAYFKDFQIDIELVCKGTPSQCAESYRSLLNYCTTGGTEMMIATTWHGTGKAGVFFVKCSSPEAIEIGEYSNGGVPIFMWSWTATFNITKPTTDVVVTLNNDGFVLNASS